MASGARAPLSTFTEPLDARDHEAGEPRHCCNLARFVRIRCPGAAMFLRTAGYEDAFIIKNCVHGLLWCCCIISFVFSMLWLSDVLTLECSKSIWPSSLLTGGWRCAMFAVGFVIFFASFRDLVRMIAHFDDHTQRLLKKKRRLLKEIEAGCKGSLAQSAELVRSLRETVAHELTEEVVGLIRKWFCEVLPQLKRVREHVDTTSTAEIDSQVSELSWLFWQALGEDLGGPAKGLLSRMADDFPHVFDQLKEGCHLGALDAELPPPPEPFVRQAALQPLALQPQNQELSELVARDVWRYWHLRVYGADLEGLDELPRELRGRGKTLFQRVYDGRGFRDSGEDVAERLSAYLAYVAFQPAERLLSVQHHLHALERFHEEVAKQSEIPRRKQRFGFCQSLPEGHPRRNWIVIFCCCRAIAAPLSSFWTCCFGRRTPACCELGLKYNPPKTFRLGCFWIQIHTKLQERLLTGFLSSFAFMAFYAYDGYTRYKGWDVVCGSANDTVSDCVFSLLRSAVAEATLVVYCIALIPLIWNIDRLDAVMDTIVTIWQVQEIQGAVQAFNHYMRLAENETTFLKIALDRLRPRFMLLESFATNISSSTYFQAADKAQGVAMVLECLRDVQLRLPPSDAFLELGRQEQQAVVQEAETAKQDGISRLEQFAEGLGRERRRSSLSGRPSAGGVGISMAAVAAAAPALPPTTYSKMKSFPHGSF